MIDEPINFKDILKTIEAGFGKNLRTTEAHFDFTGPYKKKSVLTMLWLPVYYGDLCNKKKKKAVFRTTASPTE